MKMSNEPDNILVTGFGPFGEHRVNASWEAVSALPDSIEGFNIIKEQIPVAYKYIEDNIPILWRKYNPKLVIHVGVSSCTTVIQLETCAKKAGYIKKDVHDTCPAGGQAFHEDPDSDDCLRTDLCTRTICEKLNQHPQLKAAISNDPGRYLCEFIYYASLKQNNKIALFVHVPPLDKPFNRSQLANALEEIIKCALDLLAENDEQHLNLPASVTVYKNGRAAAF